MLLKVVPFVGDVSYHFVTVRQSHLRHFSHCRIGLFWCARHHLQTHPAAEWSVLQSRRFALILQLVSPFADELINCRHYDLCKILGYNYVSRTPGETEREYYHRLFSLQLVFGKNFPTGPNSAFLQQTIDNLG